MGFALSKEHRMIQKAMRGFARRETTPTIEEYDRDQIFDHNPLPKMALQGPPGHLLFHPFSQTKLYGSVIVIQERRTKHCTP
jgi:hypothetical protein